MLPAALLVWSVACRSQPSTAPTPDAPPAIDADAPPVIEWLDDDAAAAGATHHRIAGQASASRAHEAGLRKLARDGLVARAKTLGFSRLDNLQIEASCVDDAPEAAACTVRVVAIASR